MTDRVKKRMDITADYIACLSSRRKGFKRGFAGFPFLKSVIDWA
jgi:hypothetical protein